MTKRGLSRCFYLTLLLVLLLIPAAGPAFGSTGFPDVSDSHWAARHIAKMSELGIVGGYSDGTFRPNRTVSQVEALVMAVRCLGGSGNYQGVDVPFTVPGWARQDVARAMTLGLLKSDEAFYAESGATRAWVTRLLVRLVGKDDEARSTRLLPNFTDAYKIPDWAVGYVRVAQDYNLVGGYSDSSFRPDKTVTRAELAVFLARAMDYLGGVEYLEKLPGKQVSELVTGTIRGVYPEVGALAVEVAGGEYRTLYLPEDAGISVTGSDQQGLAALQLGDEVEITLDAGGYISSIRVKFRPGNAVNEGIVYHLDPGSSLIAIRDDNGNIHSYRLAEQVSVLVEGYRFPTLEDVREGDRVRLEVESGAVRQIEVLELSAQKTLTGTVKMISPEDRLVVLDVNGELKVFQVAADAGIEISGLASAVLGDVIAGDEVEARIENGKAVQLKVMGRQVKDELAGTVVGVDTTNRVLTFRDGNDNLHAYEIKDNARILINGEEGALGDIEKDMEVEVRLVDGEIFFLEVDNSVKGTVVGLDEGGLLLVIRDNGGNHKTYVIDENVDVDSEDGRDELDEVNRGDYVEITVDDDAVTEIKLRTQKILRVDRVRESWDRIDAEDEDGDRVRLYIRDGVDLVVPGIDYPGVEDVQEDDLVRATFTGHDLEKVEVLQPERGRVISINTYAGTVTLEYYDGETATLDFDDNCEIVINGESYDSLTALSRGNRVEVIENVKGGRTFKVMDEVTGVLAFPVDGDEVYLEDSYRGWEDYDLHKKVYVHDSSGVLSPRSLNKGDRVKLYMLNDLVYEIEVL